MTCSRCTVACADCEQVISSTNALASPSPSAAVAVLAVAGVGLYALIDLWRNRTRVVGGYENGRPKAIAVVGIGGTLVEVSTAKMFAKMREAAARDGITLRVTSGFRTMDEQRHLYDCFVSCSCNGCHKAEVPGYSKHQNGRALDLNTRGPGVFLWLRSHAGKFGFFATEPGEPWHWERK